MNRKILNVQALRGIAALMVLLPHLKHYDVRFGGDQIAGGTLWNLGNAGVDLFFVISGFVMVATTMGRNGPSAQPGQFMLRRAARIYPLYWIISLAVLVVYLRNSAMVNSSDAGMKIDLLKSFLLLPQRATPLVAQGWTLVHEFYFYLVFAFLLLFREIWTPVILLAWGVLVSAASVPFSQRNPELNIIANPLTLEFITGCFVALVTQRKIVWRGEWALAAGVALLVICGMRVTDLASAWQRVAGYGIPAALIVFGAVAVERTGKTAPRWLIAIGDASYSLYLTHGLVLALIARWAWEKQRLPIGQLINPTVAAAMAAAAIAAAILCYRLIELPLIGVTKKLFAPRKPVYRPGNDVVQVLA